MNKDLAKIIPSHNRPVTAGNKKESIKRVSTPKEKIKIEKNNDKENPNLSKTLSKKENKNDLKISEIKSRKSQKRKGRKIKRRKSQKRERKKRKRRKNQRRKS